MFWYFCRIQIENCFRPSLFVSVIYRCPIFINLPCVSRINELPFLRYKYNQLNWCNSGISEFVLPNLRPIYATRRKTFDQTITSVGYVISSLHNHVCYNSVLVFLYMCVCVWFVLVLQFSIFHQQRTIFRAIVACGKSYFYSH